MKNIFFSVFLLILVSSLHGQTLPENRWILGTWSGTDASNNNFQFVFNDDGTGSSAGVDIIFSINGNSLAIFSSAGTAIRTNIIVYRINDQRIVMSFRSGGSEWVVNLNRVN